MIILSKSVLTLACLLPLSLAASESGADAVGPEDSSVDRASHGLDLLGGAVWSESRIELGLGKVTLDVDGARHDQDAAYLGGGVIAVSGYSNRPKADVGGIFGVGVLVKSWASTDGVDISAIVPFAVVAGGGYANLSDRHRLDATARFGPGAAFTTIENDSDTATLAWTYGIETALTLRSGDYAGLGLALGWERTTLLDFQQSGLYVGLRFGL